MKKFKVLCTCKGLNGECKECKGTGEVIIVTESDSVPEGTIEELELTEKDKELCNGIVKSIFENFDKRIEEYNKLDKDV